jgi:hypothetical protein
MPTIITRITFSPVGSIEVKFVTDFKGWPVGEGARDDAPRDYTVHWGRVALHPWQAEEAERDHGWTNLGSQSKAELLAQGLVEVDRSVVTYNRRCIEQVDKLREQADKLRQMRC